MMVKKEEVGGEWEGARISREGAGRGGGLSVLLREAVEMDNLQLLEEGGLAGLGGAGDEHLEDLALLQGKQVSTGQGEGRRQEFEYQWIDN